MFPLISECLSLNYQKISLASSHHISLYFHLVFGAMLLMNQCCILYPGAVCSPGNCYQVCGFNCQQSAVRQSYRTITQNNLELCDKSESWLTQMRTSPWLLDWNREIIKNMRSDVRYFYDYVGEDSLLRLGELQCKYGEPVFWVMGVRGGLSWLWT